MCCVHNYEVEKHYDIICNEFDDTRNRIWDSVKYFLEMNSNSVHKNKLLEVGVGNGKNLIYAQKLNFECIGTDISNNLINVCKSKQINNVYKKDILELNISDYGRFNHIICIAVIHHLQTITEQKKAIKNMIDCLCENGKILISVWSHEIFNKTEKRSNDYRKFNIGPNLVEWKSKKKDFSINRFYFIHSFDTLNEMLNEIKTERTFSYDIKWEKQNWFCEITL